MELLKHLNTDNIDFILIDRLIRSKDGSFDDLLEFTVWEKPKGLVITGYKVRHKLEDAFKIFDKLSEFDVDSNYMITDLEDSRVLAGISCDESFVSRLLGDGELNKIELRVPHNSIYSVLYDALKSNATIKTESSAGFGPLRSLYFNESTLDIVWRYKDPSSCFKTYPIVQDGIISDFSVRCGDVLNSVGCSVHNVDGGLIEHNFCGSMITSDGFELYSNGVKLDNLYLVAIVSVELLINYFARAFESTIRSKVVDALYSHVCEIEQTKYGRSAYRVPRDYENICTIKYPTRMPSTTKILSIMNEINYKADMRNNLPVLLKKCSEMYSDDTVGIINDCLSHYLNSSIMSLIPITRIDSVSVGYESAISSLLANCLKSNFARNDIFRKSHVGKLSRLASSVFDASIDIQTFPDQNILLQQYFKQQGL